MLDPYRYVTEDGIQLDWYKIDSTFEVVPVLEGKRCSLAIFANRNAKNLVEGDIYLRIDRL